MLMHLVLDLQLRHAAAGAQVVEVHQLVRLRHRLGRLQGSGFRAQDSGRPLEHLDSTMITAHVIMW